MDGRTRASLDNLYSKDGNVRFEALNHILRATDQPVDWAYEVWDEVVANLKHSDNHYRAIAAQLLCNLAKSDPGKRMLEDFDALLAVTRDERFVTARHCLQAIWKVGVAGREQQTLVLNGLAGRFKDCVKEMNCTLIRYDIIAGLRQLYDAVKEEPVRQQALTLIETETNSKYRAKYVALWRVG